jgi:Tol biopolymer transport system component
MRVDAGNHTLRAAAVLLLAASLLWLWTGAAPAAPGDLLCASTTPGGVLGDAGSYAPCISANGRYVAFYSSAENLVPDDNNATKDVFRKDLQTGAMVRCSTKANGDQVSGASAFPSISADGRYVAFSSDAATLVPGDGNGKQDIFRKDLQTGAIVLCSTDSGGNEGNGSSYTCSISADGRYVAFYSDASDLLGAGNDTNGFQDIFRKDLQTGAIVRCSSNAAWGQSNGPSYQPSISADGRYVAFESDATNLVLPNMNAFRDVYRKDVQTGAIVRCSTSSGGAEGNNGGSSYASISSDGKFVAFESDATNLVGGDTNITRDIFRKNLQTGTTVCCSTRASGVEGNYASYAASISADGRYVAFHSASDNLVSGDDNTFSDIFRKDLQAGTIVRCSTAPGVGEGDGDSVEPAIDAEGMYVAFVSKAANFVDGDTGGFIDVFRKELSLPVPTLTSIDPTSGEVGEVVTLDGQDFRATRFPGSYVSFGGTRATQYISWSNTEIVCRVPAGVAGTVPVTVTTGGGTSNAIDFTGPSVTFYFAEGYTGPGFHEYLCLGNPGTAPVDVTVTFLFKGGSTPLVQHHEVPAQSRVTLDVNQTVGEGKDVSIMCEAGAPYVAERPMYFDYTGAGEHWTGGHDVVGASAPTTTWYFAEGYTGPGFDEWVCVLNPGDGDVDLTFRFQTPGGTEMAIGGKSVPAHSRETFKANELLGGAYEASLKLVASEPVVAERPMYFDYLGAGAPRHWSGGHCVMGAPDLAREYYFAEGYTGPGFEEYLTIQNPSGAEISVDALYQLGSGQGEPVHATYTVPAKGRRTVFVNGPEGVGEGKDASVRLTSDKPFLAERPMYFDYTGYGNWHWKGGHCVIGATETSQTWFFAEGYTGTGFDEYLCIQNPGDSDTDVRVVYYPSGGGAAIVMVQPTVAANSRYTVYVNADAGTGLSISAKVDADQPVICERPMYFNFSGLDGGHDVVGYIP